MGFARAKIPIAFCFQVSHNPSHYQCWLCSIEFRRRYEWLPALSSLPFRLQCSFHIIAARICCYSMLDRTKLHWFHPLNERRWWSLAKPIYLTLPVSPFKRFCSANWRRDCRAALSASPNAEVQIPDLCGIDTCRPKIKSERTFGPH